MTTKIEERLAHLEKLTDDLNDEVVRQAAEIDRLKRRVGLLLDREAEREAEGTGGVVMGDEKPPHY